MTKLKRINMLHTTYVIGQTRLDRTITVALTLKNIILGQCWSFNVLILVSSSETHTTLNKKFVFVKDYAPNYMLDPTKCQIRKQVLIFFFFFDLGFTALSRIFHLYRADRSSKVGENRRTRRKTTWPSVSRTWLSHIWPERGSNHSGEKPNGLRVNSLIH